MKMSWSLFKRTKQEPILVGRVIDVSLPKLGIYDIEAKVDTGAFSGALHAREIREEKLENGRKVLVFKPANCNKTQRVRKYQVKNVKSSNGQVSKRYLINTKVQIKDQEYALTITLADRADMKYQVLIGRKFLRSHGFLVDVSKNKT
jgi:hypothetical protein